MQKLFILFLLPCICFAFWSSKGTVVDNPKKASPNPSNSWVANQDGILTNAQVEKLNSMITNLNQNGKLLRGCSSGVELTVVVINTMNSYDTSESAAQSFARNLHDSWGVGEASCNNGVVFLMAKNDRVLWVSVGQGTKYILTDRKIQSMKGEAIPLLKKGKTGDAVLYMTERMVEMLFTGEEVPPTWTESIGDFFERNFLNNPIFTIGVFVTIFAVIAWSERKKRQELEKLETRQKQLKDMMDKQNLPDKKIEACMCPICLDDFKTPFDKWTEETVKAEGLQVLRCGHAFHQKCVLDWIQKNSSCPICRTSVFDNKKPGDKTEARPGPRTDQQDQNRNPNLSSTEETTYVHQHQPVFVRPIQDRLWFDYVLLRTSSRITTVRQSLAPKKSSGSSFGGGRSSRSGGGGFKW
jgi:uncharacterized membrane protein YgcG